MKTDSSPQAARIATLISEKFGDAPEYLWAKYPDFAVFRSPISRKWYAIIMCIAREKLEVGASGAVDIINVKLDPDEIEDLLKHRGFFPAYHMNKQHWLTIPLDDTLPDGDIMNLVAESYLHAAAKIPKARK